MLLFSNGIVKSDLGAAFTGGWGICFIVVNDAIVAFIYHFIVAFDISGSARADDMFRIIGILVAFKQIIFIVLTDIWILRPYIDSFYVLVFFFVFGHKLLNRLLLPKRKVSTFSSVISSSIISISFAFNCSVSFIFL